jgi:hypothetical protein
VAIPGRSIDVTAMQPTAIRILIAVLSLLVFSGIGVLCVFFPHRVQRAERIGPINLVPPLRFLRDYKAGPGYITHLRVGGAFAFIAALLTLYALVRLFMQLL